MRFLLGTDEVGRDILSRLLHGARLSLMIGLVSVLISLIPDVALGFLGLGAQPPMPEWGTMLASAR